MKDIANTAVQFSRDDVAAMIGFKNEKSILKNDPNNQEY
jgi:hypothetical protein